MMGDNRVVRSAAIGGYLYSAVSMPLALALRMSDAGSLLVLVAGVSVTVCLGLWTLMKAMRAGWVAITEGTPMRYSTMKWFIGVCGAMNLASWVVAWRLVGDGSGTRAMALVGMLSLVILFQSSEAVFASDRRFRRS